MTYMFALEGSSPKPATPSKDLSRGARALIDIIASTPAEETVVKLRQVTELIGEEKANELCLFVRPMKRLIRPRVRPGTLIPPEKQVAVTELAGFRVDELYDAIMEAQRKPAPPRTFKYNPEPNPEILKAAKEQAGVEDDGE